LPAAYDVKKRQNVPGNGLREGPRSFDFRISVDIYNFGDFLIARERNFDEFKSGGLHEKHAVATWNLLNDKRKTKETCVEMAGRRTFRIHTDF
jgi:hypothetical protein